MNKRIFRIATGAGILVVAVAASAVVAQTARDYISIVGSSTVYPFATVVAENFGLITDLERIGDEAEKIGFLASRLAAVERPANNYRELKNLGAHVRGMIHDALDTFSRLDPDGALMVVEEDKSVDEEYESIMRQCITFMMEDPRTIRRVMDVMWAARSLERIGDHAKNICEYVIYMVHGKDIRHIKLDDVKDQFADGS